ncbi:sensor histidine kinase [Agrococcus sp. Marseille-P2731]|uniref:sensor histidine kinase n=1 Tax=Agrococcus sp. Marseille-P2731 TaxID=1841862 RepID=UPI0009F96348|nr:sensor histidine kinase [Agrococcus sp. Marseille-P2731]
MTDAALRRPPADDPRVWDAYVGIGALVLSGVACFAAPTPAAIGLGASGVLVIAVAYALTRRRMVADRPSAAFQVVAVIACAAAAYAFGPLASAQALVAPLLWMSSGTSTRRAVVTNVALFGAVLGAFALRGSEIGLLATTQALSLAFSLVIGLWISGLARANDERERLIGELEHAHASVARLSGEQATAAERARMARDLHDTIAQDLAAIAMLAQRSQLDREALRSIEQLAQDSLVQVRGMAAAHAGVGLDDGLQVALERLGGRFQAETGVVVAVEAALVPLPVDVEVALLRTAQEALANVRKHAAARRVEVRVSTDASGTVLSVADDGQGFDRASVSRGLGLQGLDERMALAGGSLEIESSPAGTTVTARLAAAPAATQGGGA